MQILRLFFLLVAGSVSLLSNPFAEAERSFLEQLNSLAGIELAGGPFHASEQHHFEAESGYFVLAPATPIPTIDQRLTIQMRTIPLTETVPALSNALPTAHPPYSHDHRLTTADRQRIHARLAASGLGSRRDEITALGHHTVQLRTVWYLPIVRIFSASEPSTNGLPPEVIVLLGAQSWQGTPLYRIYFDRLDPAFPLRELRISAATRRPHEVALRSPVLVPQTFFAEPGLTPTEWSSILRNFASIDLPAIELIDATLNENSVTLFADHERPSLPQQWVKLENKNGRWQIKQAIEFRAEFPRPGAWWTFLPLLPLSNPPDLFPESKIPPVTRRNIISLVRQLRGVGEITALNPADNENTVLVRTAYSPGNGFNLHLARRENTWRFLSIKEWRE